MTIGVIGAGAWGTALAQAMASDGSDVVLWAREADLVEEINRQRTNSLFLPSARLAATIRATGDLAELADCPVLLVVTPAQHLARVLAGLPDAPRDLVLCSKGIEAGTGRLMADVAKQAAPTASIAVLSGPTFAHEVAAGLPTAVTLACALTGCANAVVNFRLAPLGRKIGPDPASINACKIGGIAANNASGMCCGTAQNSYRTLQGI